MAYGQLIPYKKGEGAKISCPNCEGEGICPSWNKQSIPPKCEGCKGRGTVSKKDYKILIQNGFFKL